MSNKKSAKAKDEGNRLDSIIDLLTDTRSIYGQNLRALAQWYKATGNTKGQYACRQVLETLQAGFARREERLRLARKEKISGPITFRFGPREGAEKYSRIARLDSSGQLGRWKYPVTVVYKGKGYDNFESVGQLSFSKQYRTMAPDIQRALGSDDFKQWLKLSENERRTRFDEEREDRKTKQRRQVSRQEPIPQEAHAALLRAGIDTDALDSLDAFIAHAPLLRQGKHKLAILAHILDPNNKGGIERRMRAALEEENGPPTGTEDMQTVLEHYSTPGYKPEAWEIAAGRAWYYQHGKHLKAGLIGAFAEDLLWINKNSAQYARFCQDNPTAAFDKDLDKTFLPAKPHPATALAKPIEVRKFLDSATVECTIAEAAGFERAYTGLTTFRQEYGKHLITRFFGNSDELHAAYDLLSEFKAEDDERLRCITDARGEQKHRRRRKNSSDSAAAQSDDPDTLFGEVLGGKVKDFLDFGKSTEKPIEENLAYNYRITDQLTLFPELAILSHKLAMIKDHRRSSDHSFVPEKDRPIQPPSAMEHGLVRVKYLLLSEYARAHAPEIILAKTSKRTYGNMPSEAIYTDAHIMKSLACADDAVTQVSANRALVDTITSALSVVTETYIPRTKDLTIQDRRTLDMANFQAKAADKLQAVALKILGDAKQGLIAPEYTSGKNPIVTRFVRLARELLPITPVVQSQIESIAFLERARILSADYHYESEKGAPFSCAPLIGKQYATKTQLDQVAELVTMLESERILAYGHPAHRLALEKAVAFHNRVKATYGTDGHWSHWNNRGSNLLPIRDGLSSSDYVAKCVPHLRPQVRDANRLLADEARLQPYSDIVKSEVRLVETIARARLSEEDISLAELAKKLIATRADPTGDFFSCVLHTKLQTTPMHERISISNGLRDALNDEYERRCLDLPR